jgi:hypothetical protein
MPPTNGWISIGIPGVPSFLPLVEIDSRQRDVQNVANMREERTARIVIAVIAIVAIGYLVGRSRPPKPQSAQEELELRQLEERQAAEAEIRQRTGGNELPPPEERNKGGLRP